MQDRFSRHKEATLLLSVVEKAVKQLKEAASSCRHNQDRRKKVSVPYVHGLSHSLKKVASKGEVDGLFSAPQKASVRLLN